MDAPKKVKLLTTAEIIARYCHAGDERNLVLIELPNPMVYEGKEVRRMRCHQQVAMRFLAIFKDILAHYGLQKIKELGIDRFGGCFKYQKIRGGND